MNSLSARERRLVAIGILIALIAFVWLGLVAPILSGFSERTVERARLTDMFARNERLIAGIPKLRVAAEAQKRDAPRFHTNGNNIAVATELLKERLGSQITAIGGEVRSIQEVSDRPGWARASAESRMTLPQLIGILEKLQNEPPYLAVETLTISADRALQSGKLDLMDIRIEVSSPISAPQPR